MTITKLEEYYLAFQMLSIKSRTREFIHKLKSKKISRNLLGLFTDFSRKRKQRVFSTATFHLILGQYQYLCSSRFYIRSTFIPPIYTDDLSDNLQHKLFADNTSLFSTVKIPKRTPNNLNNDLMETNKTSP